ncbi:MAG: flagellar basal body protein [Syntrophales bacterium]|jgi:flagellar basal-body rod protein FlgB|nr:flagellar basal body protein [Syntrophales bacterium]MDY0043095.1 flagellar basal body protein [Syntrophales bacterium]
MNALFGKTTEMLSLLLGYHSERHKIISSNIANMDTPGYQPKDMIFDKELAKKIASQRSGGEISVKEAADEGVFIVVNDGSRVNIDKEMSKLAENHLMYNLKAELLARKFRGLKDIVKGMK